MDSKLLQLNDRGERLGAFMLAELTIRDPERFLEYGTAVIPIIESFGGKVLAVSVPAPEPLEGEPVDRSLVVHGWPSMDRWTEFYESPEYQPVKAIRLECCDSRITILPTLPPDFRLS